MPRFLTSVFVIYHKRQQMLNYASFTSAPGIGDDRGDIDDSLARHHFDVCRMRNMRIGQLPLSASSHAGKCRAPPKPSAIIDLRYRLAILFLYYQLKRRPLDEKHSWIARPRFCDEQRYRDFYYEPARLGIQARSAGHLRD